MKICSNSLLFLDGSGFIECIWTFLPIVNPWIFSVLSSQKVSITSTFPSVMVTSCILSGPSQLGLHWARFLWWLLNDLPYRFSLDGDVSQWMAFVRWSERRNICLRKTLCRWTKGLEFCPSEAPQTHYSQTIIMRQGMSTQVANFVFCF